MKLENLTKGELIAYIQQEGQTDLALYHAAISRMEHEFNEYVRCSDLSVSEGNKAKDTASASYPVAMVHFESSIKYLEQSEKHWKRYRKYMKLADDFARNLTRME